METALQRYQAHLTATGRLSPLTVRNYVNDISHFLQFLRQEGVTELSKVNRLGIRSYLAALMEQRYARGSIARKVSTIRSFFGYLEREGTVTASPLGGPRSKGGIGPPKQERRLPTFLSLDEVARFLAAPDVSTAQGQRDRALLELLYAAGLRVSEVVSLDLGQVNLAQQEVRVWGKGAKERVALLGRPAAQALEQYLRAGRAQLLAGRSGSTGSPHSAQALFLNRFGQRLSQRGVQLLMKKYATQAGLDKRIYPHLVRHTFATHLLDGGADLRVVQELLGHAQLTSTQIYTHVSQARSHQVYTEAFYAQLDRYFERDDEDFSPPRPQPEHPGES